MNTPNPYKTSQSLGKAISWVCEKLPKSPQKKQAVSNAFAKIGENGLVGEGVATTIGRFMVQILLGAWPGLGTNLITSLPMTLRLK